MWPVHPCRLCSPHAPTPTASTAAMRRRYTWRRRAARVNPRLQNSPFHSSPIHTPSPRHLRSLLSAGRWFFVWSFVVFLSCIVWCFSCRVFCVCDLFLFVQLPCSHPPYSHPADAARRARRHRQRRRRRCELSIHSSPIHRRFIIQRGHEHTRTGS